MSHREPAYVIFDGDSDRWAYSYMRGWKQNERVDFDFNDAHDLDNMTARAQGEEYVKRHLKERMKQSKSAIVLIGNSTKNLYTFVRWELELARELDLPIIAVNLNGLRQQDNSLVPPIIRDKTVVHVSFKMKIIRHALDNWPNEYRRLWNNGDGARYYADSVYRDLGITD